MTKLKNWLALGTLVLLALTLVACSTGSDSPEAFANNGDGYTNISAQQLVEMLKVKDFVLVNVHIPYEGEIPQTDLFIAYDEVSARGDQLPDKNASIVLYCRSGSMSTSAAESLVASGYTGVIELDGGFEAWKASGYELLYQNQ